MVRQPRPHWLEPLHVPDRVFFVIAGAMMIVMFWVQIWAWPLLPSPVPQHLNFAGQVDSFAPKNIWNVFGPLLINIVILLGIAFAYAHPEYTNLPTSIPWKKLPAAKRGMAVMAVRHLLTMTFLWSTLIISCISLALISSGLGVTIPLLTVAMMSALGLLFVTVGGYTLILTRWLDQGIDR